jgi:apolipoprotein N-acyltransferase
MDSPAFYIVYLCFLAVNLILCLLYYFFRNKKVNFSNIHPILRLFTIVAISIWFLDSIPYLYIPIASFSDANIIISNTFMGLIGVTAIFYELASININKRRKAAKTK